MTSRPLHLRIEEALDRYSAELRAAFIRAIGNIADEARLGRIEAALAAGDVAGVLDGVGYERAMFREFEDALRAAYVAGGVTASDYLSQSKRLGGLRVRFNPFAERPAAWLAAHSSGLITRITQDQAEAVRATLSLGMADGRSARAVALDIVGRQGPNRKRVGGIIGLTKPQAETVAWVRQALRSQNAEGLREYLTLKARDQRFDRTILKAIGGASLDKDKADRIGDALASRYLATRGHVIGRTEGLEAINAGQFAAHEQMAEEAGLDAPRIKRIWRTTGQRTRDTHAAMSGQVVEGLHTPFRSPRGARMKYPGDRSLGAGAAEVVNCRCWVQTKIELDF